MQVTKISNSQNFTARQTTTEKKDYLKMFQDNIKNSADMTDTIVVPRTIFKGYLGIMTGTSLLTLGSILNKFKKTSASLNTLGVISSLYGTWAFVRPFIVKDANGVQTKK